LIPFRIETCKTNRGSYNLRLILISLVKFFIMMFVYIDGRAVYARLRMLRKKYNDRGY